MKIESRGGIARAASRAFAIVCGVVVAFCISHSVAAAEWPKQVMISISGTFPSHVIGPHTAPAPGDPSTFSLNATVELNGQTLTYNATDGRFETKTDGKATKSTSPAHCNDTLTNVTQQSTTTAWFAGGMLIVTRASEANFPSKGPCARVRQSVHETLGFKLENEACTFGYTRVTGNGAVSNWITIVDQRCDITLPGQARQPAVAQIPSPAPATPAVPPPAPVQTAPAAPMPANHPTAAPAPSPAEPTQPGTQSLSPEQERALKPQEAFKECATCPQMVVLPAGTFMMGLSASDPIAADDRPFTADEVPQHRVTIARQFAVGKFEVTFDEWDACVADGGCGGYKPSDQGWGRGGRPVINVSFDDAKAYVAWLSTKTGKTYRLLSEAEYEYAARAGTTTAYPWGAAIGKNNANCDGCGSQFGKRTAPVGSFRPNKFGLYDMVGNVFEWTADCYHKSYQGAPADGSAWTDDCLTGNTAATIYGASRGGGWSFIPFFLRSAERIGTALSVRANVQGFRVARTLESLVPAESVPPSPAQAVPN